MRKPKFKEKGESKFKKLGGLKNKLRRKKGEKAETAGEGKKSKSGRFKGGLGKIGNLKKAIPFKGKKKEKD